MAGTGDQMIARAEQALKSAQDYERMCGNAQVGTPQGNDYANAQRATARAQTDLNAAKAKWS